MPNNKAVPNSATWIAPKTITNIHIYWIPNLLIILRVFWFCYKKYFRNGTTVIEPWSNGEVTDDSGRVDLGTVISGFHEGNLITTVIFVCDWIIHPSNNLYWYRLTTSVEIVIRFPRHGRQKSLSQPFRAIIVFRRPKCFGQTICPIGASSSV